MIKKRVLFLCTGNYYRSRFAEIIFNHLASSQSLPWIADSCGLHVHPDGVINIGPLSPFAEAGLEMRAIAIPAPRRFPRQATHNDFRSADLVIAVKQTEHRPLMESLFPEHLPQVTFWNIHDLDAAPPLEALETIERHVRDLVIRLSQAHSPEKQ